MSCELVTVSARPAKKSDCPCGCGGACGCGEKKVQKKDCGCGCGGTCSDTHSHHHNHGFNPFSYPFMPINLNVNNSPTTTSSHTDINAPQYERESTIPVVYQEPMIRETAQRINRRIERIYDKPAQDQVIIERVADNPIELQPIKKRKLFKIHTVPTWY